MIQRVCRQLDEAGLLSATTIVTNQSQVEITRNHIGEHIPIVIEPCKRGTFMAVCSAASYLHTKLSVAVDETICVLPVDSFVESELFAMLHRLPRLLAESGTELALIGVKPSHPSTQYGYIVPQVQVPNQNDYYQVTRFIEKPGEELAAELISEHALWNCGIFAFSMRFMLACMIKRGLPVAFDALLEQYEDYPEQSFDVEVTQKTPQCIVLPYDHIWNDLGDWSVLPSVLEQAVTGNGYVSSDSRNTHIINENEIPIYVIGLSNTIVAASPDGILVADKKKSNQIKRLYQETRKPMYEEKRWGTLRVLDDSSANQASTIRKVEFMPGKYTSYHRHVNRKEVWTVLAGDGEFICNGVKQDIQPGDVLQIPSGVDHAVRASSMLQIIEIRIGEELIEDESIRAAMNWEDTLRLCGLMPD